MSSNSSIHRPPTVVKGAQTIINYWQRLYSPSPCFAVSIYDFIVVESTSSATSSQLPQMHVRILGRNSSARHPVAFRRIATGACDYVTPPVCPGRGMRTTNLVRPCRPRTNPRWHRRRRGVGRLRRDASGVRQGADPPRGQGGVRSAYCMASARGAPSSSDVILGTKREKRGTANLGERVVELEIRICCGVTRQPESRRGCQHP